MSIPNSESVVAKVDHSVRAHHPMGPSKLNYLDPAVGGCPGFRQDNGSSEAAEEGTACHEIVEKVIRRWLASNHVLSIAFTAADMRDWDDDTDNLLAHVWTYLEKTIKPGDEIYVEPQVELLNPDGTQLNFGSLDLLLVRKRTAVLIDWKFGFIPVPRAGVNRQGMNYAAAVFQMLPELDSITVAFVQPRRQWVSEHLFKRGHCPEIQVQDILYRANDPGAERYPGRACTYCNRTAECPDYLRRFKQGVVAVGGIDLPTELNLDAIDTPEKAAIAREWVAFLELALDPIKKRATAIAETNGGVLSAKVGDRTISWKLMSKGLNREVGDAVQVATALANYVEPTQLLGAASLSLGKLEEIVIPAMQQVSPEKLTKKAAKSALHTLLELQGLLTRPDGQVQFLKQVKEETNV